MYSQLLDQQCVTLKLCMEMCNGILCTSVLSPVLLSLLLNFCSTFTCVPLQWLRQIENHHPRLLANIKADILNSLYERTGFLRY